MPGTPPSRRARALLLNDPDITEKHRIPMALELNGAGFGGFLLAATGRAGDFHVIVNEDAILPHGGDGVLGLFAVGVEARGLEINVVGLPGERREAGVEARFDLRVD